MKIIGIISVIGVIILIIITIVINNQIIKKKNMFLQAFSSIDVYLKKRFDLVPNLVALLQRYAQHEKDILTQVTELRSQADKATSPTEKVETSNKLNTIISSFDVTVEKYPEIKADKQFLNLQYILTEIEEQLAAARRAYNAGVTDFNNKIQKFPANIVAKVRGDKTVKLLEIPNLDHEIFK